MWYPYTPEPAPEPVSDTALQLFSQAYKELIDRPLDRVITIAEAIRALQPVSEALYAAPTATAPSLAPTAESQPPPPANEPAPTAESQPSTPEPEPEFSLQPPPATELRTAELRELLELGIDRYKPVFFSEVERLQATSVGFRTISAMLNAADLPAQTGHKPTNPGNIRKALNRWQDEQAWAGTYEE